MLSALLHAHMTRRTSNSFAEVPISVCSDVDTRACAASISPRHWKSDHHNIDTYPAHPLTIGRCRQHAGSVRGDHNHEITCIRALHSAITTSARDGASREKCFELGEEALVGLRLGTQGTRMMSVTLTRREISQELVPTACWRVCALKDHHCPLSPSLGQTGQRMASCTYRSWCPESKTPVGNRYSSD